MQSSPNMEVLNSLRRSKTKRAALGERLLLTALQYRKVAILAWGELPQLCHFCNKPCRRWNGKVCVHHLDRDRENNVPENLVFAHSKCHNDHHEAERKAAASERSTKMWEERREEQTAAIRAARGTDESRQRTSEATTAGWQDPTVRANRRAGIKKAWDEADREDRGARVAAGIMKSSKERKRRSATAKEINARKVPCPHGCGFTSNPGATGRHAKACSRQKETAS